jgi:sialate O-acetylesterase
MNVDKPIIWLQPMTMDLKGEWKYELGLNPRLLKALFIRWKPTGLYNAMIAPIKFKN